MSQACDPVATSLLYKDGILALPARTLDNPVDEVLFNLHVTSLMEAAWIPLGGVCLRNFSIWRVDRSVIYFFLFEALLKREKRRRGELIL